MNGRPDIAVFEFRCDSLTKCGSGVLMLLNNLRDARCAALCTVGGQAAFDNRCEVVTPSSALGLVKNDVSPIEDFQPVGN